LTAIKAARETRARPGGDKEHAMTGRTKTPESTVFDAFAAWSAPAPAIVEAMHFMARRYRAYGDYLDALSSASDPAAIMHANIAFMRQIGADYAAEAKSIAKFAAPSRAPQP
jgi:hypothetical protein